LKPQTGQKVRLEDFETSGDALVAALKEGCHDVFEDYDSAAKALEQADFLISYTCNVVASVETAET